MTTKSEPNVCSFNPAAFERKMRENWKQKVLKAKGLGRTWSSSPPQLPQAAFSETENQSQCFKVSGLWVGSKGLMWLMTNHCVVVAGDCGCGTILGNMFFFVYHRDGQSNKQPANKVDVHQSKTKKTNNIYEYLSLDGQLVNSLPNDSHPWNDWDQSSIKQMRA